MVCLGRSSGLAQLPLESFHAVVDVLGHPAQRFPVPAGLAVAGFQVVLVQSL